jgi:hypothetical protein
MDLERPHMPRRRRELEVKHVLQVLDPVLQVLVDAREELQHLAALDLHEATHVDDDARAQLHPDALADARRRLLLGGVATLERVRRALEEDVEGSRLVTCEAARKTHQVRHESSACTRTRSNG